MRPDTRSLRARGAEPHPSGEWDFQDLESQHAAFRTQLQIMDREAEEDG